MLVISFEVLFSISSNFVSFKKIWFSAKILSQTNVSQQHCIVGINYWQVFLADIPNFNSLFVIILTEKKHKYLKQ